MSVVVLGEDESQNLKIQNGRCLFTYKLLSKKSFYLIKYFSNNFDISVLFGMALWKQYIESHVANTNVLPLI